MATELHAHLLDRVGALLEQDLADLGRAGERQLAHQVVAGQLAADLLGAAGHDIEHTLRDPGALGELGQCERGIGREARGLGHDRAARGQRRRAFARDHRVRKVPGRDRGADAHRLLEHHQAPAVGDRRDDVAVDPLALLRIPLDEGGTIGDLAARFGERLALLAGHQDREILLVRHHQVEPFAQDLRALLGGRPAPALEGAIGRLDRAPGLGSTQLRHRADDLARGRVADLAGRAVVGADPGAVDVALLAEQARIGQLNAKILERGSHAVPSTVRCRTPAPPDARAAAVMLRKWAARAVSTAGRSPTRPAEGSRGPLPLQPARKVAASSFKVARRPRIVSTSARLVVF